MKDISQAYNAGKKCPKCGGAVYVYNTALCSNPPQYTYFCSEDNCDWTRTMFEFESLKMKQLPNQTAKADAGKERITLVPLSILKKIARVRMYGTDKYKDPDNWKRVEEYRYKDALCRHLIEYINDPKSVDEESGLEHLWHIACNVAFLCEMEDWEHERGNS